MSLQSLGYSYDKIATGDISSRPAGPNVEGQFRLNNELGYAEFWSKNEWRQLQWVPKPRNLSPFNPTTGDYSGLKYCSEMNLNAGQTMTIQGSLMVICIGDVKIDGIIQGSKDTSGPTAHHIGFGTRGPTTYNGIISEQAVTYVGPGMGLGAGTATNGGNRYAAAVSLMGSSGAGGFVAHKPPPGGPAGPQSFFTGDAGSSGASILIRCLGTLTLNGTITSRGGDGFQSFATNPSNQAIVTGPGGGSGGIVILESDRNLTLGNSSSINVSGGKGGNGHMEQAFGGGGGGGGIIVCQSNFGEVIHPGGRYPGSTATPPNVTMNGGINGIAGPTPNIGGGGGGGCGGRGGDGDPMSAGGIGTFGFDGSPLSAFL